MVHEPAKPHLTIVIGANGSGKTTWAQQNRAFLPKPFYNADSIAEGLGDPNDTALQAQARRIVDQAIEDDLAHRRSFGFESTYSGRSRPNIVIRARQLGYATRAVFIGTDHHSTNIARVRKRVEEGDNDHFAFGGGGPHLCLGAFLARLEVSVLLQEMAARRMHLRQLGDPVAVASNFVHGVLSVDMEPEMLL